MTAPPPPFFVVGGTLAQDAPSYVRREADSELFRLLRSGEYCHILTPRQMGKSSLMVRTAADLRAAGSVAILLDLTALGVNVSPEQWYRGQVRRMGRQLGLEEEVESHWRTTTERGLGAYQRWEAVLTEILLPHCNGPVVVFIDEIDIVRSLPFSADEYFAGIRQLYNARTGNPALKRLTFCLLGVVTPFELIQDPRHTPFNVGRQIELRDFSEAEVTVSLARGLITARRGVRAVTQLLRRVLYWTGGQPYLTQRFCEQIASDSDALHPRDVDRWCRLTFFGRADRIAADDHLLFVRERLLRGGADLAAVLIAYQEMLRRSRSFWRRGRGLDDAKEENPTTASLRLSGIARLGSDGMLLPRNRIYRTVFDEKWAASQMPEAEGRRLKRAYRLGIIRALIGSGTVTAAVGGLATVALLANARARSAEAETRRQLYVADMNLAQRALEENNITRALQLLERHRRAPAEASRFEWRYLWEQCHQAAVSLPTQSGGVSVVRFGAGASELLAMDAATLAIRSFSLNGSAGQERMPGIPLSGKALSKGTLSPDATHAARCFGDQCEISEVSSATTIGRFAIRKDSVYALALSSDNRWLAVGDIFGGITIWDVRREKVQHTLVREGALPTAVSFSPDGQRLVLGASDSTVRAWDCGSGREIWHKEIGRGNIRALGFSPDGRVLIAGVRDGTVYLLDAASGETVRTMKGHTASILAVAVSRAGDTVATSSKDKTIRVWNRNTGIAGRVFRVENPATTLAISADGKWLVAGGKAGDISLWRLGDSESIEAPSALSHPLSSVRLSPPDGRFCSAIDNTGRLSVWEVSSRRVVFTTKFDAPPILTSTYSPDGRRIAGSADSNAVVYDASNGQILSSFAIKGNFIRAMALSVNGELFATFDGNNGTIQVWRTDTGEMISDCHVSKQKSVSVLAFAANGESLIAGSADGSAIYVIHPRNGHFQTIRGGHTGVISEIVFSTDGRHMATVGHDAFVQLWLLQNNLPVKPRMLSGHTAEIYAATFFPDGKSLLTGGADRAIRVWDVATFQEVLALPKHQSVYSLQFEHNHYRLYSTDREGTTRFWGSTTDPPKK
ncbi:MAG: AAA-like domain-containing protein [Fibrella sp.]|nr:AAA-like domain-containing protein [Armatimonadota bacterium]